MRCRPTPSHLLWVLRQLPLLKQYWSHQFVSSQELLDWEQQLHPLLKVESRTSNISKTPQVRFSYLSCPQNIPEGMSPTDLFMYGMFCVLLAAAFWDNMACHLELPVSTTHTTGIFSCYWIYIVDLMLSISGLVGAIVGMTMVLRGGGAVIWSESQDEFPYYKGMSAIFSSWFASPIAAGIVVLIVFGFIRTFVLRSEHSFDRGYYVCFINCTSNTTILTLQFSLHQLLPIFSCLTFFVMVLFIIQTGNKQSSWDNVSDGKAVGISAAFGVFFGLFTLFVVMPILKRWVIEEAESREQ